MSFPQGATPPLISTEAYGTTFGMEPMNRDVFKRPRRRMNLVPMAVNLFVPWAVFIATFVPMGSTMHQTSPAATYALVVISALIVATAGVYFFEAKFTKEQSTRQPSWFGFFFISMLVAWIVGMVLGGLSYSAHVVKASELDGMVTYSDVDPMAMRGQQVMDGGVFRFSKEARVDLQRSMAFRNKKMYCVAPVRRQEEAPDAGQSVDFWVVGTDCCGTSGDDYHCPGFNDIEVVANRLLDDTARPFYRLAVQQAEAKYNIVANHPIFMTMEAKGSAAGARDLPTKHAALVTRNLLMGVVFFFIFQMFMVIVGSMFFSKLA